MLSPTRAASSGGVVSSPLTKELEALGYVQGRNLTVYARGADGDAERLPGLAAELVRLRPDVIYTAGTPAARAAKDATSTIPIIIGFLSDPVQSGLVPSLDRPGGNLTGVANFSLELAGKHVELLRTIVPATRRIAVLMTSNPNHPLMLRQAQKAGSDYRVAIVPVRADGPAELDAAFAEIARNKCDGLIGLTDPLSHAMRREIAEQTLKARLPAVFAVRNHAEVGSLASYGEKISTAIALQARYIDKLFKGARPADLPIQQPTDFELVVNMKTARMLGITVPQAVLLRADAVIE